LKAYRHLAPDLVVVYDGYDPTYGDAHGRRDSRVFRLTGYLPMTAVRARASASGAPRLDPALADGVQPGGDVSCAGAFVAYCGAMIETVRFALAGGVSVLVVTPPYVSVRHQRQQASLAEVLRAGFDREPRFRYVDLGPLVDLHDLTQSPDGVQTTLAANQTIARARSRVPSSISSSAAEALDRDVRSIGPASAAQLSLLSSPTPAELAAPHHVRSAHRLPWKVFADLMRRALRPIATRRDHRP
jgi:hypothetical protein